MFFTFYLFKIQQKKIRINDHSYDFYHRVPLNQINKLAIYGDMKIYKIAFSGVCIFSFDKLTFFEISCKKKIIVLL